MAKHCYWAPDVPEAWRRLIRHLHHDPAKCEAEKDEWAPDYMEVSAYIERRMRGLRA